MNIHNVVTMRRQVKNVVKNYSDPEKKVREATSNDPWGPSSSLMTEIADMTYNVMAFVIHVYAGEIMAMIWKRLNDHGKNWRHVYKALTLLDYIIKTGSERVAQQCRENIHVIQTLKDFQYSDKENKDQGLNVREKAKNMVALLKDDERLKTERSRAMKAKERFAQAAAVGIGPNNQAKYGVGIVRSDANDSWSTTSKTEIRTDPALSPDIAKAKPQTEAEEELQLQLALAMSREEADKVDQLQKGDDIRLKLAMQESNHAHNGDSLKTNTKLADFALSSPNEDSWSSQPPMTDPWSAPVQDPWSAPVQDPWGSSTASTPAVSQIAVKGPPDNDPWTATGDVNTDQWNNPPAPYLPAKVDAFSPNPLGIDPFAAHDEFDLLRANNATYPQANANSGVPSSFDVAPLGKSLTPQFSPPPSDQHKKSPENFLGNNANLVNLESLLQPASLPPQGIGMNPFMPPPTVAVSNPFEAQRAPAPTLNQLKLANQMPANFSGVATGNSLPDPLLPVHGNNPFSQI